MTPKLINAVSDRFNRKIIPSVYYARDFDELITQHDQNKLLGYSRGLYYNNPIVERGIEQKAQYATGNAWQYRSTSLDESAQVIFNEAINQWAAICEVSGMSLNELVYLISVKLDVDGDVAVLLTQTTENNYPQVKLIEAHSIGSRHIGKQDLGSTFEEKGIIYAKKTKRVLKYRILGPTEAEDTVVDAKDLVFIKEPSNNLRGVPIVSSAIRMFYDLQMSQELLLTQHLMATTMSIVEHNPSGSNEVNLNDNCGDTPGLNVETLNNEGGEIRYYRANTGSSLEFLKSENPSIEWKQYQDQLTNICILAINWNKSLLGLGDGGTGTNDRLSIQQASNTVKDRQNLLTPFIQRICNYALAKLVKGGYITINTVPTDWYKSRFTYPKLLSIDFGRDSKALMEEYKLGIKNMTQLLAEEGIDYTDHLRQRMSEEAIRIKVKEEMEQFYGVEIDKLDTRLINANQLTQQDENI